MSRLDERNIDCPYCGENIGILIDAQEIGEPYVEDCQVCCRPIVIKVTEDDSGKLIVLGYSENDVF